MSTKSNIVIDQATTIHFEIPLFNEEGEPLTISTGITANAMIRENWESTSGYSFDCSFSQANDVTQQVILNLDMDASTSALIPPGIYQYDVVLVTLGNTIRLLEGNATVSPAISQRG